MEKQDIINSNTHVVISRLCHTEHQMLLHETTPFLQSILYVGDKTCQDCSSFLKRERGREKGREREREEGRTDSVNKNQVLTIIKSNDMQTVQ